VNGGAVAKRLVVGISGSSGAIYGARLVEVLAGLPEIECHLVMSKAARMTIAFETEYEAAQVEQWADFTYDERDIGAAIASGTCRIDGMIVAPCSIKTLSQIASSNSESLLTRAADVSLKERRRLVLVVRETPLHRGHLELMLRATDAGAVILPPVPGFYIRPATIRELVDHTITKVLDLFDIDANLVPRWAGLPTSAFES
jgi:4-hydroxy-3-polyprenylbenzoate decarboxylase